MTDDELNELLCRADADLVDHVAAQCDTDGALRGIADRDRSAGPRRVSWWVWLLLFLAISLGLIALVGVLV